MKLHTALAGQDVDGLKRGMYFAAAMIVVAAGCKLAAALGWPAAEASGWAQRGTMVLIGVFLALVGNAMPKTLPPLDATNCDQSRLQRLMRVAGWTWVIAGLALAIAWLTLPSRIADPLTFILMPAAILIVVVRYLSN
jgi:hypothetical protein